MKVLLDTHVLLWTFYRPDRIPPGTAEVLRDGGNEILWSAVGTAELAIKVSKGKIRLKKSLEAFLGDRRTDLALVHLPVEHRHALATADLPRIHGDPFDRLLVAQAKVEGIPLVSSDTVLRKYGIEVIW
jgi:PIN domain nuclease of toxin-antitoxin system